MTLKKLPLTIKPFADLIDENYLYADKTEYIYKLLSSPLSEFFLSRPRRFGKTLLLHTLNEIFTVGRKRFEGLWINESDYDFPAHPVIFLSLSIDSDSPERLRRSLMTELEEIAAANNLRVRGDSPNAYFSGLIKALHTKYKTKVVVLIDEYDDPVTANMEEPHLAKANAKILRSFFASLKKPYVTSSLHFTFVTGITRYALTSMDSGPNHLNDISLDPAYAGICGFLATEFDSLFGDRMELALASLKKTGEMAPSADIKQLREEIDFWYDGYDWGGESKILNPYSILKFFHSLSFDQYWIQSGRPAHLTAMLNSRPLDFVTAKLESYPGEKLRKTELTHLEVVPVLFHSGYLTLDMINAASKQVLKTDKIKYYSFKLPNYEVQSSYYRDCFTLFFGQHSTDDLQAKGKELLKALMAKDAETVSFIFSGYFSSMSCYQRPNDEKTFHALAQMLLSGMGFKIRTELIGPSNRLDLCLELPKSLYIIIELKHCSSKKKLTKKEIEWILANVAKDRLRPQEINESLADIAITKLKYNDVHSTSTLRKGPKRNRLLADLALKLLPESDINQALAATARLKLPEAEIDQALSNTSDKTVSNAQIDSILSDAAQRALSDITERNYHGMLKKEAKAFIDLGLAFYGYGEKIKAAFGVK
ncbi:MAG: AAA family ATPase [Deltaproteobacteria bacterium]|nr:AAA family ATPase [Deltaproteobacteria bacterium]